MKVIIDTEENTLQLTGPVLIPDLSEFVNKYGFGDYKLKIQDIADNTYDSGKVITNDDEPINPDDYTWANSPIVGMVLNATKDGLEHPDPKRSWQP